MPHTRRHFLLSLAGATTGLLAGCAGRGPLAQGIAAPPSQDLRIGLVLPSAGLAPARVQSLTRGAQLGAEEAAHAAGLFGGTVKLAIDDDAQRVIGAHGAQVLIGGTDEADCGTLMAVARSAGVLFFNVGCAADELRSDRCDRHTFHVAASSAMQRDAAALGNVPTSPAGVMMWHESLERFGAGQLNARFRDRFGAGMNSDAWATWFAVKVVAETALRERTTNPEELVAALERSSARFDGHKGRPLTFRSWDHQLRQPLYIPGGGGEPHEIVEVPGRAAAGETVADQLDRLGATANERRCSWEKQ